jgi:hypothetical protein
VAAGAGHWTGFQEPKDILPHNPLRNETGSLGSTVPFHLLSTHRCFPLGLSKFLQGEKPDGLSPLSLSLSLSLSLCSLS